MGVSGKEIKYQEDKRLRQVTPGNPRSGTFSIIMIGLMIIIFFMAIALFFRSEESDLMADVTESASEQEGRPFKSLPVLLTTCPATGPVRLHQDPAVRKAVGVSLGYPKQEEAGQLLRFLVADSHASVRDAA